ncbi:hypothetical protein AALP_AA1G337400 [Arabis alpina]|uniref:Uncharacterized protein n=1 Tax=Arabis alpina TaxID=50452 RepID=A0A087HSE6_ARAAL|nr:hypothetical protein AALP_AA1G337400 [Arabis alpina]
MYEFQCRRPFIVGWRTYLTELRTEQERQRNLAEYNDLITGRQIVGVQRVLEEFFTEPEMLMLHRDDDNNNMDQYGGNGPPEDGNTSTPNLPVSQVVTLRSASTSSFGLPYSMSFWNDHNSEEYSPLDASYLLEEDYPMFDITTDSVDPDNTVMLSSDESRDDSSTDVVSQISLTNPVEHVEAALPLAMVLPESPATNKPFLGLTLTCGPTPHETIPTSDSDGDASSTDGRINDGGC